MWPAQNRKKKRFGEWDLDSDLVLNCHHYLNNFETVGNYSVHRWKVAVNFGGKIKLHIQSV
jgi:hypothetical protein